MTKRPSSRFMSPMQFYSIWYSILGFKKLKPGTIFSSSYKLEKCILTRPNTAKMLVSRQEPLNHFFESFDSN